MNRIISTALVVAVAGLAASAGPDPMSQHKPEFMVIGIDNKATWGEDGKLQLLPPGKDAVTIVDIGTDPANPKIVASLPLMNSIFGPPTNLGITPNGQLALVANSVDWVADGANWKSVPDNKLYVIDLTTSPPALIDTVAVGKQPSGMSINRAGSLRRQLPRLGPLRAAGGRRHRHQHRHACEAAGQAGVDAGENLVSRRLDFNHRHWPGAGLKAFNERRGG